MDQKIFENDRNIKAQTKAKMTYEKFQDIKMNKTNAITREQREGLLELIKSDGRLLNEPIDANLKQLFADAVNRRHGPKKDPDQAYKSWRDWKRKLLKKLKEHNEEVKKNNVSTVRFCPLDIQCLTFLAKDSSSVTKAQQGGLLQRKSVSVIFQQPQNQRKLNNRLLTPSVPLIPRQSTLLNIQRIAEADTSCLTFQHANPSVVPSEGQDIPFQPMNVPPPIDLPSGSHTPMSSDDSNYCNMEYNSQVIDEDLYGLGDYSNLPAPTHGVVSVQPAGIKPVMERPNIIQLVSSLPTAPAANTLPVNAATRSQKSGLSVSSKTHNNESRNSYDATNFNDNDSILLNDDHDSLDINFDQDALNENFPFASESDLFCAFDGLETGPNSLQNLEIKEREKKKSLKTRTTPATTSKIALEFLKERQENKNINDNKKMTLEQERVALEKERLELAQTRFRIWMENNRKKQVCLEKIEQYLEIIAASSVQLMKHFRNEEM